MARIMVAWLLPVAHAFSSMPTEPTCPEPTMFDTLDPAMQMAQMVNKGQSPSRKSW
jgi:hypothetical protein